MRRVAVEKLEPGMVVARDVCDRSGRRLLGKGCPVVDKHRRILRAWGVHEIDVAAAGVSEDSVPAPVPPALLAAVTAEVAPRFRHQPPEHPAVRILIEVCAQRLARQRMHGDAGRA